MKSSPKTPASAKKPKTPLVSGGMVGKKTPNAKQSPASPNLKPAKTPVKTPAKQAVKAPNPTTQTKQTPQKKEKIQAAQTPKAQNGQSQKATPKQAPVQKSPVKAAPAEAGTIQADVDLKMKEKPQMFLKVITTQEVTNEELKKELKGLYSLKVARKQIRNGVKQKIYTAQFNSVAAATKARKQLESMKDKVLHVFYREAFPVIAGVVYSKTKLFLTGCPETVSNQDVKDVFPNATIDRPKSNRSKRGSFFVEFPTAADTEEAFNKSKNLQMKNTKILVAYAIDKTAATKGKQPAAKKAKAEKATVAKPAAAKTGVAAATPSKAAPGAKRKAEEPESEDESDDEGDEIIMNEGESGEEISDEDDDDDSLLDESD